MVELPEQSHSPERHDDLRSQAVEAWRAYNETGKEEAKEKYIALLNQWIVTEEAMVESGEQDRLDLCLNIAEFFEEAGAIEKAIENFEDVANVAWGFKKFKVYKEIQARIKKLKGSS